MSGLELAELLFVALEVVLKGRHYALHVIGGNNYAAGNHAGSPDNIHEVEDKFLASMGHLHDVGVNSLENIIRDFYLNLLSGWLVVL